MRVKVAAVLPIALLAGACAKAPEAITASYVSDLQYQNLSCPQLASESSRLYDALATASGQQRQARSNDVVGVILIGLPVSSLSGDNIAPEIARYKGELEAIHRVGLSKGCPTARASTPVGKPSAG